MNTPDEDLEGNLDGGGMEGIAKGTIAKLNQVQGFIVFSQISLHRKQLRIKGIHSIFTQFPFRYQNNCLENTVFKLDEDLRAVITKREEGLHDH